MLSGRALALVVLAWSLLKVLVGRLFGRKTGLPLFHENYDADGLPALDPAERERVASFSRCIACGRCDVGEADRIAASGGEYPGLMTIVLSSSRSMPDYDAAARSLAHVPMEVLAQKEEICPTRVPFVELARFVRSKAGSKQLPTPSVMAATAEEDAASAPAEREHPPATAPT
ncbi:hypothetical protein [Polyangium sp. y55x31]|uniref:hypothetical protein n=1 Tax=Polyangium sp. y55x31 TaxID=3042688 RepID=UPI002482C1C5|nr:hypothetical protein [Polyangium sp. y55x31]MDI1478770.1 hypothetical protein [Polyangium sp. y55x31]